MNAVPTPKVTMIGGGQLARITHQSAIALGQTLRVLAVTADDPAAQVTPDVALAIVNAQSLIGSLLIPPVGSGYLDPSTTSSIESTLDTFNNGNAVGGPSHCQ